MLRILSDMSTPTCVVVEMGGPVTAEELEAVDNAVTSAVGAAGEAGASMVIKLDGAPRLDGPATVRHAADLKADALALHRIAWVSAVKYLTEGADIFGWLVPVDQRVFYADELEAAVAWAS
jgi:hypothetical protein